MGRALRVIAALLLAAGALTPLATAAPASYDDAQDTNFNMDLRQVRNDDTASTIIHEADTWHPWNETDLGGFYVKFDMDADGAIDSCVFARYEVSSASLRGWTPSTCPRPTGGTVPNPSPKPATDRNITVTKPAVNRLRLEFSRQLLTDLGQRGDGYGYYVWISNAAGNPWDAIPDNRDPVLRHTLGSAAVSPGSDQSPPVNASQNDEGRTSDTPAGGAPTETRTMDQGRAGDAARTSDGAGTNAQGAGGSGQIGQAPAGDVPVESPGSELVAAPGTAAPGFPWLVVVAVVGVLGLFGAVLLSRRLRPVVVAPVDGPAPTVRPLDVGAPATGPAAAATEARPPSGPPAPLGADGTVTIMFTDIESSTPIVERLGDRAWHAVLRAHKEVVARSVAEHGAEKVETAGDGFMATFSSARAALRCAIAIQREVASSSGADGEHLLVRIGVHTGDVIREAADFYGRHLHLAARVGAQAAGGEILASMVTREVAKGDEFSFGRPRSVELKGIAGTTRVVPVEWSAERRPRRPDAGSVPAGAPD